jgi:hypothetical protein
MISKACPYVFNNSGRTVLTKIPTHMRTWVGENYLVLVCENPCMKQDNYFTVTIQYLNDDSDYRHSHRSPTHHEIPNHRSISCCLPGYCERLWCSSQMALGGVNGGKIRNPICRRLKHRTILQSCTQDRTRVPASRRN